MSSKAERICGRMHVMSPLVLRELSDSCQVSKNLKLHHCCKWRMLIFICVQRCLKKRFWSDNQIAFDFMNLTTERQQNKKMSLYPAVLPFLITLRAWAQTAYVKLYCIASYWDTHLCVCVWVSLDKEQKIQLNHEEKPVKVIILIQNHCSLLIFNLNALIHHD